MIKNWCSAIGPSNVDKLIAKLMDDPVDYSWQAIVDVPGVEIRREARTDDAAFYEIHGLDDRDLTYMSDQMWKLAKKLLLKHGMMQPKGN